MAYVQPDEARDRRGFGVVAASIVALSLGGPLLVTSLFSVVMLTLTHALHQGRAIISSLLTVMTVCTALGSPIVGRLVDRFGPRAVILCIVPVYGASLMAMALTPGLGPMYLLMAPLGVCATVLVPVYQCLSRWFDRRRGTAMATAIGVSALVAAVLAPAEAWLLGRYGWQGCFVAVGALVLGVSWPTLALLFRAPSASSGRAGAAVAVEQVGATLLEATRTPVFWALMATMALMQFVQSAFRVHAVALVHDRGLHLAAGVGALAIVQVATTAGRLAEGWGLDSFDTPKIAAPFILLGMAGLAIVQVAHTASAMWLGSALIGISSGGEIVALSYFLTRYFGLKAFGQIYGVNYVAGAVGIGLGPLVFGVIFDRAGSYAIGLTALQVMLGIVLLTVLWLPRYAYGERTARRPRKGALSQATAA